MREDFPLKDSLSVEESGAVPQGSMSRYVPWTHDERSRKRGAKTD